MSSSVVSLVTADSVPIAVPPFVCVVVVVAVCLSNDSIALSTVDLTSFKRPKSSCKKMSKSSFPVIPISSIKFITS